MNKLKHTAGPWKFDEIGLRIIGKNNESICYIDYHNIKHLPYKSNARLISMSPEMLEVLIKLTYIPHELAKVDLILFNDIIKIIEKATGLTIEEAVE